MRDLKTQTVLSSLDPRAMELILYPTEQCNFRCTYCYEDFALGKMAPHVVAGVKALIARRVPAIRSLSLSWFGGEPLLAKEIIYDICEFAQTECASHGVSLRGDITTNGYFLDLETVRKLSAYGQANFQVSLDGYGAAHDQTRKLMSGGPTFQRIWANLLALRDAQLEFHLMFRLHLTTDNLASIEVLAAVLRQEFLHDQRFSVFVKTIENLGNDAAQPLLIPRLERQAAHARIAAALGHQAAPADGPGGAAATPAAAAPAASAAPAPAAPTICYAARPNSLAVRANGTVQKCTVMMNHDINQLATLQADGSMRLDRDKMAYWMRGYDHDNLDELKCPAHGAPTAAQKKVIPISVATA
ncbi:radical SAM protein [Pseudoduganella sp. HUAS MS19]